jgi:single-strand DNA-binding protein
MNCCLRCLAVVFLHWHHVTLRDGRGKYLHPRLPAPLCHECHRGLHRLLQKAHVERVEVVTPDVVELRISIFLAWLDWPWLGRTTVGGSAGRAEGRPCRCPGRNRPWPIGARGMSATITGPSAAPARLGSTRTAGGEVGPHRNQKGGAASMPTGTRSRTNSAPAKGTKSKASSDTERRVEAKGPIARVGNLTRAAEVRFGGESGVAYCRFGLAVDSPKEPGNWSGERETTFYECTAFDSLSEHVAELDKGTRVIVVGKGELEHWTDAEGKERTTKRILVEACGPDLRWATATVARDRRQGSTAEPSAEAADSSAEEDF